MFEGNLPIVVAMKAKVESHERKYTFDTVPTRPTVFLDESTRPDSPTTSKLCGTPYLPEHSPYPSFDGDPLLFIAQFNFAELPPLPGFPTAGLLQLFLPDDDDWGVHFVKQVVEEGSQSPTPFARYIADLTAPHIGDVPEEVIDEGDHPAENPSVATVLDGTLGKVSVTPTAHEYSRTAFWDDDLRTILRRGEDFVEVHTYSWWIIIRRVVRGKTSIKQINLSGPTMGGQKELFEAEVARIEAEGFSVDPQTEDYVEPAVFKDAVKKSRLGGFATLWNPSRIPTDDEHIVLATVEEGDGSFVWGDCGVGNFYIHPDDLAARDFSRVIFEWDCG